MDAVYIMDITVLNWQGLGTGIRNTDIDMMDRREKISNIIRDRSFILSPKRE